MSVYALIVGIVLVGQVGAEGERYSAPSGNPFGATNTPSGAPSGSGLTPLGGSAAASDGFRRQPAAESAPAANPYSAPPVGSAPASPLQPLGSTRREAAAPDGSADARPSAGVEPAALMLAMLKAPSDSRLTGAEVALAEVVGGASSRIEQSQRIEAYWDLCSSVADYYLGLQEQAELRRLRPLVQRVGPTWQQAESELAVRIGTSQRAAAASQLRLASLMGGNDPGLLPLPGDMPHCGDYRTRYDEIFSTRPSAEAAQLSELLPLRYEELQDAATAVTRAREWLDMVAAGRSDVSDGTGTLRALELLALRRRAFVQIARDYNRRIARYAELAAPGQIDADVLIGMLIKTDRRASTATRSSTSPPRGRQSQSTSGAPPKTFADDWTPAGEDESHRDEAVAPAAAESAESIPQERSLLVPAHRP